MDGQNFYFIMIKLIYYDDDGYLIQWLCFVIFFNIFVSLNGFVEVVWNCNVFGEGVKIYFYIYDEINKCVWLEKIVWEIWCNGGKVLIVLVGVQFNQFFWVVDLVWWFIKEGFQIVVGGFYVFGCIFMLDEMFLEMVEL